MTQLGLFETPARAPAAPAFAARRARRRDPAPSKAAAASATTLASEHQRAIVEWLLARPDELGRTKDDIAEGTGLDSVAVARRMRELEAAGHVEEAGVGRLPSGRTGTLWRARRAPGFTD